MEEIAQVYARSLFEVAKEQSKLDVVREQLGQFADALDANRELATFFFAPYFSTPEKKEGLGRLAGVKGHRGLLRAIGALVDIEAAGVVGEEGGALGAPEPGPGAPEPDQPPVEIPQLAVLRLGRRHG